MDSKNMMLTMREMKTHPSAQALGFFDVELRVQWLEAKGNPLSRLKVVIDERFLPALHWAAVPSRRRGAGAAVGLINLIYPATTGARYEQIVRLKLLPRTAA